MPERPPPRSKDTASDSSRFDSKDPYIVLGLPRTATIVDVKKARNILQRRFHTDITKDNKTLEVSQRINAAATELIKLLEGRHGRSTPPSAEPSTPPQPRSETHGGGRAETRDTKPKDEWTEFWSSLGSVTAFKTYLRDAKVRGVPEKQIQEWLRSDRVKDHLVFEFTVDSLYLNEHPDRVVENILEWETVGVPRKTFTEDKSFLKAIRDLALNNIKVFGDRTVNRFVQFITPWKKIGLDLSDVATTPAAQKFFEFQVVDICIKIHGEQNPNRYLQFVNMWRAAGVDLSGFIRQPKAQAQLEFRAVEIYIKIHGENDPNKFLDFVEAWKAAGVDLSNMVERPAAQEFLRFRAIDINIRIHGDKNPDKFLAFVNAWRRAGVDLSGLVNDPAAQKFLTLAADIKFRYNDEEFVSYVTSWRQAGWRPPQEILDKLKIFT